MFKVSYSSQVGQISPALHLFCKNKPFSLSGKLPNMAKLFKNLLPGVNVTHYQTGKRRAELNLQLQNTCTDLCRNVRRIVFAKNICQEKRKSSLVQKGIYSTSDILLLRSHLSYWVTITFLLLLLLKPDWRCHRCCGLLKTRGRNAKADVF